MSDKIGIRTIEDIGLYHGDLYLVCGFAENSSTNSETLKKEFPFQGNSYKFLHNTYIDESKTKSNVASKVSSDKKAIPELRDSPKVVPMDSYMEISALMKKKSLNFKFAVPRKQAM